MSALRWLKSVLDRPRGVSDPVAEATALEPPVRVLPFPVNLSRWNSTTESIPLEGGLGFPGGDAPKTRPAYEDFQFEWRNDRSCSRDGHPIRCVFVASRTPLDNPQLVDLLS
jgi:hypothetical protein